MGVGRTEALVGECRTFLTDRLREELALVWERGRPGMPAQVAVLDEMLAMLGGGRLPERPDLRILLCGYGHHDDYDPSWTDLLH